MDPEAPSPLAPFLVTARIAAFSTLLVLSVGLPLARLLSRAGRRGGAAARLAGLVETLALVPMVLPPTSLGYFLLVALGKRSPIGAFFASIGFPLVFSEAGAVLAAAVAAFPLFLQPAKAAFDGVEESVEDAARLLGMPEPALLLKVTLPLAAPGLLAGTFLAFARAVGDFGTTLMVAGAIPGKTETVAISIYEAVQAGDDRRALLLAGAVALFALTALAGVRWVGRGRNRHP